MQSIFEEDTFKKKIDDTTFKLVHFRHFKCVSKQIDVINNGKLGQVRILLPLYDRSTWTLRSKIIKKANGCLLKDRRRARGRFVYSADISQP